MPVSRLRVIWLPIGRLLAVADHPISERQRGLKHRQTSPATRATPRPAKSDDHTIHKEASGPSRQETAINETVALINCCLTIRAQAVRFENSKTILNADSATAMGEYYFTTLEGTVAKVEYTFQYKRGADGNLKIVVHHSSLPYSP